MGKTKKMSYIKLFTTLFLVTMFAIVASVKVSKNLAKSTSTAETETEIETKDVYTEAQFKIDQKALMVSFRACIKECKQKFSDRSKANYTSNKRACMNVCLATKNESFSPNAERFASQKCAATNSCN